MLGLTRPRIYLAGCSLARRRTRLHPRIRSAGRSVGLAVTKNKITIFRLTLLKNDLFSEHHRTPAFRGCRSRVTVAGASLTECSTASYILHVCLCLAAQASAFVNSEIDCGNRARIIT